MSSLANQHAVVTGATRGIGWAIAQELARLGATLTLMGRDQKLLAERSKTLSNAHTEQVDVSNEAQVKSAFANAIRKNGPIQVLVNNAGAVESAPFNKTSAELWHSMLETNLSSVYFCTQQVLPTMLTTKAGRIINIASTAGLKAYPYVSAYVAAKHGVVGLTRALALETVTSGITVNAICPGFTDTDLITNTANKLSAKTGRSADDVRADYLKSVPMGRMVKPSEVASAAGWLCLPEQAAITGQCITIAAGEMI